MDRVTGRPQGHQATVTVEGDLWAESPNGLTVHGAQRCEKPHDWVFLRADVDTVERGVGTVVAVAA